MSEPITINNERINSVTTEAQAIVQSTIQYIIQEADTQHAYTWTTSNGINSNIFASGSTITLTCEKNIRHIVGYLVSKNKDSNNNDITFTAGTAVEVLPNTKFSTSVLRYTDGLPGSWLVELDGVGLRLASTALVPLTGEHTIVFSYTYLVTENETEVHTTEEPASQSP